MIESAAPAEQLGRAFAVVESFVRQVDEEQWSAPTPCDHWSVQQLVNHLVGMNVVFTAMLCDQPPPARTERSAVELVEAFAVSATNLQDAFRRPGILQQAFSGPLGTATGADRLQIRLYDLLAHGWDLARATGQDARLLPDDLAEQALPFARGQVDDRSRPGRFGPAQPIADDAPAIDRLAAFLGRQVATTGPSSNRSPRQPSGTGALPSPSSGPNR